MIYIKAMKRRLKILNKCFNNSENREKMQLYPKTDKLQYLCEVNCLKEKKPVYKKVTLLFHWINPIPPYPPSKIPGAAGYFFTLR